MDKMKESLPAECVDRCFGKWLVCSKQVLRRNNLNIYVYAAAIRAGIIIDRQKNNNIMLVVPTVENLLPPRSHIDPSHLRKINWFPVSNRAEYCIRTPFLRTAMELHQDILTK